jgi:hypothetical protein
MGKSGKKSILLDIHQPDHIEKCIEFANRKSKGLRLGILYTYDMGLKISVAGPKDTRKLFEMQLREFENSLYDEE